MVSLTQLLGSKAFPTHLRLRIVAVFFALAVFYAGFTLWRDEVWMWQRTAGRTQLSITYDLMHPIKKLMIDARDEHQRALETKRSYDLPSIAARYRDRRGRHPPPGFDKWAEAAIAADAVVVEDYFDRIYKDLAPFWALDAATLASRAAAGEFVVKVRDGNVTMQGLEEDRVPWLQNWSKLVGEFAEHLPDVDMPVNMMDEPRIVVPHENISALVQAELQARRLVPVADVTTSFTGLKHIDESNPQPYEPEWFGTDNAYWDLAVKACPPGTPAHGVPSAGDFASPAAVPPNWRPPYAFRGYVRDWTAALDPCAQPHLRQLHGSFVAPLSISTTPELVPLFGGCKLPINNEILIPGAMYLSDEERYSGGADHGPRWDAKRDALVWRGVDSGGRARETTWHRLQRHRLVEMLNATTVARVERTGERALAFDLPPPDLYPSPRRRAGSDPAPLGTWLARLADAGFTSLCHPRGCDFLRPYLRTAPAVPMSRQYEAKFLPDVDGNSYSARFRAFLLSTSLPLKASVYAEWHDDRLAPWVHFVPLDNTLQDLYPVLEFFADGEGGPGDAAAHHVAEEGKRWAETVLRREDMRLYVWRLLLEWARVCDEKRHQLGFVADLTG